MPVHLSPGACPLPLNSAPDAEVVLSSSSHETAQNMYLWLKGGRSLTDALLDDFQRDSFRRQPNPMLAYKGMS